MRITRAEGVYLYTDDGRRLIDAHLFVVGEYSRARASGNRRGDCRAGREAGSRVAGGIHSRCGWRSCASGLQKVLPARARTHLFLGRWLDGRGSGAEDGGAILAEHRPTGEEERSWRWSTPITATRWARCRWAPTSSFSDPFRELLFPVHRVHSAYCYRCPVGKTRATCDIDCVDQLRATARRKAAARLRR